MKKLQKLKFTDFFKTVNLKENRLVFFGLIALALLLSLTKASFLTPVILILLLAAILPYSYGFITRSVIAGLILFCINAVIAAIFLVLNLDATNTFLVSLCWSIVLAGGGAIKLRLNRQIYNLNSPF
ncbi:MAG TPA: hypothetical protein VNX65_03325, partial [Patescibacteria group bacterium]|nr:hypothetical protein [Patescibacteria group bacterium]